MSVVRLAAGALALAALAFSATLGTVVPLVGGAADIVLDEPRSRLYLVNSNLSRIEVYSIGQRRFLNPIRTESLPLSCAMSRDGRFLYVASYDGTALNVVDLERQEVVNRVSLPAKPEGVAVGNDDRVLISTIGAGTNNQSNVLLIYDPLAAEMRSLTPVQITPPPPASPLLPAPSGRIFLSNRSQLLASADGRWIVGVNIPNANSRAVFVYEVASGSVLRSRVVANVSSVLSVAPDGSRFMAGLNLFDTETLDVLAQQNTANSPYPFATGTNFNVQQNQGGSAFAPDGSTLYSAFNIAPVQNPPARANVSQLMLNDPDNLLIRMGIQLPENLTGKMVVTADGSIIYALSESGLTIIPIGSANQNPIAVPEATALLLANDQCGVNAGSRNQSISVRNEGRGRMLVTAQVLQTTPTGPVGLGGVGGPGGGAPGGPVIIVIPPVPPDVRPEPAPIPPGATTPVQNTGVTANAPTVRSIAGPDTTRLDFAYSDSTAARALGTVSPTHTFLLQSNEAVNIPAGVRVYQNFRNAEAQGEVVPIQVGLSANEGLEDMVMDGARQRVYIANSGLNRVEIYDIGERRLLPPIKVGQLPRSLAMTPDGGTLYVAGTGGETISIVDLQTLRVTGRVRFPPLPFNSAAPLMTPSVLAAGIRGLQVIMNNGTVWKVVGDEALPRPLSSAIGSTVLQAPRTMAATPNGEYIIVLAGNGFVYLYDALADEFVQSRQVFTNPIQGYYGPVAAGPRGQFYLVNGTVLNQALTPVATGGGLPVGNRPVSAVAVGSGTTFVRMTQPVRATAAALPTETPTIDSVDANTGLMLRSAPALEGPISTAVGNARVNVNGRTLAVDPSGFTAYALTTSGLSILPLTTPPATERPTVNPNGTVSLSSYNPAFAPGSLISIFGRNLGNSGALDSAAPTIMGGACVTLNNQPLPLLMTSSGQINAQIPTEVAPGRYPLVIRSLDRKSASLPQQIQVARYAPAVFADPATKEALVFRHDGSMVTRSHPAKRDERLMLFATGLGATPGTRVASGQPAPADPLAETDELKLFFGDPRLKQSEMIVEWSGLVPGFIGLYQVNLRVPGERSRGADLPVTLRIGGVDSQTTGPAVPAIAVD
jgi:uncharacterized protein (TIGR03437 family)